MAIRRPDSKILHCDSCAILGAGISGLAAARLLISMGGRVVLLDDQDRSADPAAAELVEAGARAIWGRPDEAGARAALEGVDALIPSPGVPDSHPVKIEARRRGLPSVGEIELAWLRSGPSRVAAITGTNGKTTVTMLVRHLMAAGGLNAMEVGNIGEAFADAVRERAAELDAMAFSLEVSSFQLEDIERFNPDVAVLLNITPDHLDRHGTMEAYAAAKARVTMNQGPEQVLVVNQDDAECLRIASLSPARTLRFSLNRPVDEGAWLDHETLVISLNGAKPKRLTELGNLRLFGMHNVANCLAGACAAAAMGVGIKAIGEALETFEAAPHRLQSVDTLKGVLYVNDSKATNIDAMVQAIRSFSAPIHLIAGGRDKDSPFASVANVVKDRVERAYLIGEAADLIERAWAGGVETLRCGTMERALEEATSRAAEGDVVLLAPGCASFDQFKNYKDRGEKFIHWVQARGEATGQS